MVLYHTRILYRNISKFFNKFILSVRFTHVFVHSLDQRVITDLMEGKFLEI